MNLGGDFTTNSSEINTGTGCNAAHTWMHALTSKFEFLVYIEYTMCFIPLGQSLLLACILNHMFEYQLVQHT